MDRSPLRNAVVKGLTPLRVHRALTLSRDRVAPAEYADFRAFCQGVDDALARRITVHLPHRAEDTAR